MKFLRIIIFILFMICAATLRISAQQNPPFKDWKYIDAGHYRIIFPEGLEKIAQRTANLMIYYEKYNYAGMSTEPDYIPIVIIEDYSEANGFVSFAPFYSHWFTTPSSFDSIDWFTGLAIHEGRHMVQRNRLQEGGAKYSWYVILGNYGTALYLGLFIPNWYLEGDAVVMETALTNGGRGRIASFPMWYRTLELSGRRYSYYRATLGTYNDMYPYPDPYSLGYLVNSYVRKYYSRAAWDNVLEYTDRSCLYPSFDNALELATGHDLNEIYNTALDRYREYWKNNLEGMEFTESAQVFPERKDKWESFAFPFIYGDSIYAIRFARDRSLSLVKRTADETDELRMIPYDIISPLFHHERGISAGGGYILWREAIPDPRWGYRSYSDLRLYNVESGKTLDLTDNKKFIAAALSADGTTAAAVEYIAAKGYSLELFSIADMKNSGSYELNDAGHIYDPAIQGNLVALCTQEKEGNSIIIFDTENGKKTRIIDTTHLEHFRSPIFHNEYLFFVSDYTGIDNIYAVNLKNRKRFQVTSVMYGAYFPSISPGNNALLYNEYTLTGYKTVSSSIDPSAWISFEKLKKPADPYIDAIAAQELGRGGNVPDDLPEQKYVANEYNTLLHGMTIPGWIPFFNFTNYDFSFNIFTQDVLHTLQAGAGYTYNFNEKTHTAAGTLLYSALYPVLILTGSYGNRTRWISDKKNRYNGIEFITWMEKTASAEINLPLNFSRGIHSTFMDIGARGVLVDIRDIDPPVYRIYSDMENNGLLKYSSYYFKMQHTVTGALNAILPRHGQIINLSYWHTPFKSDYTARMFSADATLYLPSLFSTHGFKFTGTYALNDTDDYVFTQQYLFPRGYESVTHEKFISGSVDYLFPIADFSFSPAESFEELTGYSFFLFKLFYFKRLNGGIYFDYGRGTTGDLKMDYSSAGFELTSVQNLFSNYHLLFEAGIRYSYCFETRQKVYGLVLKVPFIQM